MHPDLRKNEIKLYYCKKLKWYQWLLQKLHIKNYWKEIKGVRDITIKGEFMIKNLDKFKKVKLIDSITHQNIGGKEFIIEKQGTLRDVLDIEFGMMNIAIFNFIRRNNWFVGNDDEDEKVYYGHVIETNLGYWILESEIESELVYE